MNRRLARLGVALAAIALGGCYWAFPWSDLDSQSAGDAGSSSGGFCAARAATGPAPTFCDDFDDGGAPSMDWPVIVDPSPGTLSLDHSAFSPPYALAIGVPATAAGGPVVDATRTFTVTTKLVVEFEARADVLGDASDLVTLMVVAMHDPSTSIGRYLLYNVTSSFAEIEEEQSPPQWNGNPVRLPGPPPLGAWARYVLELDVVPEGGATITLSIGGNVVVPRTPLVQAWGAGSYDVALGLWWLSDTKSAWGFHYDDVVVTAE